jgi:hypothetical protein
VWNDKAEQEWKGGEEKRREEVREGKEKGRREGKR